MYQLWRANFSRARLFARGTHFNSFSPHHHAAGPSRSLATSCPRYTRPPLVDPKPRRRSEDEVFRSLRRINGPIANCVKKFTAEAGVKHRAGDLSEAELQDMYKKAHLLATVAVEMHEYMADKPADEKLLWAEKEEEIVRNYEKTRHLCEEAHYRSFKVVCARMAAEWRNESQPPRPLAQTVRQYSGTMGAFYRIVTAMFR